MGYTPHQDSWPTSSLEDQLSTDVPEFVRRELSARRFTAILYLQSKWNKLWGGAFRAYDLRHESGGEFGEYLDVEPGCGTLLLFRSRDLLHEVLPTTHRRFALTMWYLEAGDWA